MDGGILPLVVSAYASRISVLGFCLLATACWVGESDPPVVVPPTCNNNGTCELEKGEDCPACPGDCPCCRATLAVGSEVTAPDNAVGEADSTFATLSANSVLVLIAEQIYQGASGSDFLLVGQVDSPSSITLVDGCPQSAPSGAGYLVEASDDGKTWSTVGFWTQTTSPATTGQGQGFSLSCGSGVHLVAARQVRLSPFGTAPSARLDALVVTSCGGQ